MRMPCLSLRCLSQRCRLSSGDDGGGTPCPYVVPLLPMFRRAVGKKSTFQHTYTTATARNRPRICPVASDRRAV
jgi:hypothetical protein